VRIKPLKSSRQIDLAKEHLPNLDLPVIYVAQPYGGMSPQQMEGFISYYYEYHFLYPALVLSV